MNAKADPSQVQYRVIFILTLVHFTGDFYSSFFTPLLPAFVDRLDLTLAQVGLITGLVRFLSFIVQPVVGYLADRHEGRFFVLSGLFLAFFAIPFTGLAVHFSSLLLLLLLGSLGSSMFHPSTTGMVPLYAGNRTGTALSIFNTGGTLAFSIGPIFITWYVARFGLDAMPWTMGLGLVCFLFCLRYLPAPVSEGMASLGFIGSLKDSLGKVYKIIILIWMVMVLRAVAGQAFMTFMPVYLVQKGYSLTCVGMIVALFVASGTVSGLTAGYTADRIGYKPVFFVLFLLMTPTLLLFLYLPGAWVYPGAFLGGFFVFGPLPLGVGMAQKLAPKSRAMISSLMMGFAYGLGGLASPLIGKLSDIYGIETVLFYTAFIPLVPLVLITRFPRTR